MEQLYEAQAAFPDYASLGLEGDVAFYLDEARRAGSPVLELGCGTGRVLIPLAEAGLTVTGLDRAPAMLALARQRVSQLDAATQRRIELVKGDMRHFSLDRRFKLIMIPCRTFQHLLTVEDQRRTLACIREHLTDDGRLAFDVFDPHLERIAARLGQGPTLQRLGEYRHPHTGRRVIIWQSSCYDLERQTVDERRIFEELDDEGRVLGRQHATLTLRFIYRFEMEHLLELSGYEIEALYGDLKRGPFCPGREQVWVARKKLARGYDWLGL